MKQPVDTVKHVLVLYQLAPVGLLDTFLHPGDEAGLIFEHAGNRVFNQLLGVLPMGKGQLLEPRFNLGREMYFHSLQDTRKPEMKQRGRLEEPRSVQLGEHPCWGFCVSIRIVDSDCAEQSSANPSRNGSADCASTAFRFALMWIRAFKPKKLISHGQCSFDRGLFSRLCPECAGSVAAAIAKKPFDAKAHGQKSIDCGYLLDYHKGRNKLFCQVADSDRVTPGPSKNPH